MHLDFLRPQWRWVQTPICVANPPTRHLSTFPSYFPPPEESTGVISQQASEQSLTVFEGLLRIQLQHACMHAGKWARRTGWHPPSHCSSSLAFPCTLVGDLGQFSLSQAGLCFLEKSGDLLGPFLLRHIAIQCSKSFSSSSSL